MDITALLVAVAIWAVCGFLAYGRMLAWLQRSWPHIAEQTYGSDAGHALFTAVMGPVGLLVALFFTLRTGYGWRWTRPTDEEYTQWKKENP